MVLESDVVVRHSAAEAGQQRCGEQFATGQTVAAQGPRRAVESDRPGELRTIIRRSRQYRRRPRHFDGGCSRNDLAAVAQPLCDGNLVVRQLRTGRKQSVAAFERVAYVEEDIRSFEVGAGCRQLLAGISRAQRRGRLRSYVEGRQGTRQDGLAVAGHLPLHRVAREIGKEIFVVDLHPSFERLLGGGGGADRLQLIGHLVGMGMQRPVAGDDAVAVERSVAGVVVVVVAAEGEDMVGAVNGGIDRTVERLIDEIPDAAPLEGGIFAHEVPILFEPAHRIAHRVGVFAQNHRPRGIRCGVLLASFVAAVHRAEDVGVALQHGPLVLHGTRRVLLFQPVVGLFEVGAVARFVTQTPDDDARVVAVALHHARDALEMRRFVGGILGKRLFVVTHAVRFDVGFVDHVKAVAVAEVVPARIVGVVARAHGVDIEPLHDFDIADHLLLGDHITAVGVHFVAVRAFDEHRTSVDQQLSAGDANVAEADVELRALGDRFPVRRGDLHAVEPRGLGRPGFDAAQRCRAAEALQAVARRVADGGLRLVSQLGDGDLDRFHAPGRHDLPAQFARGGGLDADILHVLLFAGREVGLAGQAAQTPEILIFKVGAVAPAEDFKGDAVLGARNDQTRDVEAGFELAVLAVARLAAVDPDTHVRGRRADVEHDLLPGPRGRKVERAHVVAHAVVLRGDVGRVVLVMAAPGVADVQIDRIAEPVELPHAGNRHFAPGGGIRIGCVEVGRALVGRFVAFEFPESVQRQTRRVGAECGPHRQAVVFVDGRILPVGVGLSGGGVRSRGRNAEQGGSCGDCRQKAKGDFHRRSDCTVIS